jgi:hypothetical protein
MRRTRHLTAGFARLTLAGCASFASAFTHSAPAATAAVTGDNIVAPDPSRYGPRRPHFR